MLIYGAGDQGKVVCSILHKSKTAVECFFDDNIKTAQNISGHIYQVNKYSSELHINKPLVIAIGNNGIRKRISGIVSHTFDNAIDSSALISDAINIGRGNMLLTGVIINRGTRIYDHCIVNTRAVIEHDCILENFVHIGPGTILCGRVSIGELSFIGAGCTILPGIKIGKDCMVGAGSVVLEDVEDGFKIAGNPAKPI